MVRDNDSICQLCKTATSSLAIDLATQTPRWKIFPLVGQMPADIFLSPDDKRRVALTGGQRSGGLPDVSSALPKLIKRIALAHSFRAQRPPPCAGQQPAGNSIRDRSANAFRPSSTNSQPQRPDDMEVLGDGKTLFCHLRWAGKLTMIDTVTKKVVRRGWSATDPRRGRSTAMPRS
jgi:hypothetical protein